VLKKAQQVVYHSRQYPSHVLLPVIPAGEEAQALTRETVARYGAKRSPPVPVQLLHDPAR